MKLAEALIERADIQQKIQQLRSRLENNARAQDGTAPAEQPKELLKELDERLNRLQYLITHINLTNATEKTKSGITLCEAIARRDVLRMRIKAMRTLLDEGSCLVSRVTHSEIRILPTFNVQTLQKQVDGYEKELRVLDTELQESNWLTELK